MRDQVYALKIACGGLVGRTDSLKMMLSYGIATHKLLSRIDLRR